MGKVLRLITAAAALSLSLLLTTAVRAADPATTLTETNLTLPAWQSSLANLASQTEGDVSVRTQLLTLHTNALAPARSLADLIAKASGYEQAITNAARELTKLRESKPADLVPTNSFEGLDARQMESVLSQAEAELDIARKKLTTLDAEEKQRAARRAEIPKETAEAQARLDEIDLALKTKPDANEPSELSRTRQLYLLTRKAYRIQQLAALDLELKAYAATADAFSLQLQQANALITARTRRVESTRARLDEVRRAESRAAEEAARLQQAEARHPVLKSLAATNTFYTGEQVRVTEEIQRANTSRTSMEKDLTSLELDYKNLATRVAANEAAGVEITDSIGVLLRRHRVDLARRSGATNGIRDRIARITDIQLSEIDYKDQRSMLADLNGVVVSTLAEMGQPPDGRAAEEVQKLYEARLKALDELISSHDALASSLSELNSLEIRLHRSAEAFRRFVEERVLWIRSHSPLGFSRDGARAIADEARTYATLFSWHTWSSVLEGFVSGVVTSPTAATFWALALLAAFGTQPAVRRQIDRQGQLARQPTQVSLAPTLKALVLTLIISMPGPLLLFVLGRFVAGGYAPVRVASQIGSALTVGSLFYLTLGFYRHFLRANGLAVCHLGWPANTASRVRKQLNWFVTTAVPVGAFIVFAESRVGEGGQDRITFIGLMVVLAVLLHVLFNSRNGLAFNPTNSRTGATSRRLRYLAGVVMPVGLAITSALGYHLTAIEFSWRLTNSIWLVLGITLASAIIVRWFYLERRQIALEKLRLKKEIAAKTDVDKAKALEIELPEVSVIEVKEQTQSLLRTLVLISLIGGLWTLWSGVLPALNILDRKALWYAEEIAQPQDADQPSATLPGTSGLLPDMDSNPAKADTPAAPRTIKRPITLADLLLAFVFLIITGIAARNLPGFLEISILKHLKLETGGGYAITTIVQYAVTIVGLVIACATIGLTWEKVQWLAAAVTLGIGFGLQEIFANFVAGIILLFERPVRVGDIITVEDTTGVVTRIRIRATTIRNWDRQELIIPNKDLITGRLTNWTLSDTMNRVVVTVGVAYGSDTRRVREILREILRDHPDILPDPASTVVFDQFADSSLNFTVRAFLSTLDNRLETIHELHSTIHDRFNEAGIEISFPQRDLHIRSLPSGFGEPRSGA